MAKEGNGKRKAAILPDKPASKGRPSALLDTRGFYCGDNLEQLAKLPDACIDLIYIDPPFNSNRNYEVAKIRDSQAFYMMTRARNVDKDLDYHTHKSGDLFLV